MIPFRFIRHATLDDSAGSVRRRRRVGDVAGVDCAAFLRPGSRPADGARGHSDSSYGNCLCMSVRGNARDTHKTRIVSLAVHAAELPGRGRRCKRNRLPEEFEERCEPRASARPET